MYRISRKRQPTCSFVHIGFNAPKIVNEAAEIEFTEKTK